MLCLCGDSVDSLPIFYINQLLSHTGSNLCLIKDFPHAIISFLFSLITSCLLLFSVSPTSSQKHAILSISPSSISLPSIYPHLLLLSFHPLSSNYQCHLIQISVSSFKYIYFFDLEFCTPYTSDFFLTYMVATSQSSLLELHLPNIEML